MSRLCGYLHMHASSVSFMYLYHSCILCIIHASSVSFMHSLYPLCILCILHASSVSFMHSLYPSCILCTFMFLCILHASSVPSCSSVSFMHPLYPSCLGAVPQVVQSGSQSIEMAVLEKGKRLKVWAWNVWWRFSAVLRVCV